MGVMGVALEMPLGSGVAGGSDVGLDFSGDAGGILPLPVLLGLLLLLLLLLLLAEESWIWWKYVTRNWS